MTELAEQPTAADALPLGPESLVWRYFGDNRMYLIGPRPAVLQNMLAELGPGRSRPFGVLRRHRCAGQAVAAADLHDGLRRRRRQRGHPGPRLPPRPSRAICPGRGSRYHALDPDTYFWAHATFVDQVLYFADTFVKRLTRAEKEQIYLESKTWYRRYGVSDRPMPANYDEFERYWDRMIDEIVVPHQTAKYGVGYVTKGFPRPKGVPPVVWRMIAPVFNPVAAFLTTGGMPPRTRDMLGLPWSERQERRYQRFAALWRSRPVNWLWDRLPMRLRYNTFAQTGYARG